MSIRPLPSYLVQRFRGWKATVHAENRSWYQRLAEDGQRPRAMVVSCCDSRIHVTSIFGAETGEFFIHRNVANLVPPHKPDGDLHGTSAAIEYAVTGLRVAHIVVLGHTQCGGVAACHEMCAGRSPALEAETSYVGRWMDLLRPAYPDLPEGTVADRVDELARRGVVASLANLRSFPFVAEALAAGTLTLHGAFLDMGRGELSAWDPEAARFRPVAEG